MRYKRKGIDFCAIPGCLNQDYGCHVGELQFCNEHSEEIPDEMGEEEYQEYLEYAVEIAEGQGVEFGKFAES